MQGSESKPQITSDAKTRAKVRVCELIDAKAELLVDVSHQIHAHPELAFDEHFAHDLLCDTIEAEGLTVQRGAYGLDTAFEARAGTAGPVLAVCCEYDALPGIGHACGHNIIASAGLGAGLAAAAVADELGGRVSILGTPAEEGGGGKVYMIDRGAFDDVDAALMVHPADHDLLWMNTIAIHQVHVHYQGAAAHAAAAPHLGRNALDAAVLGYMNVAALRQHILPEERIHGVFSDGGDKPNIVPMTAGTYWYVRSPTLESLEPLKARVLACLEAGATAAGCTMTYEWQDPSYADMIEIEPLLGAYAANASALGRTTIEPDRMSAVVGSTDMGNVSYKVPSIHPMIKVAPDSCAIHTPEFAGHAASPLGDLAVLDGAKAMAMTMVDLWCEPDLLAAAQSAHSATR